MTSQPDEDTRTPVPALPSPALEVTPEIGATPEKQATPADEAKPAMADESQQEDEAKPAVSAESSPTDKTPSTGQASDAPKDSGASTKGDDAAARLQKAFVDRTVVEGVIVAIVRGGYEVQVEGMTGFCPFNQIDIRRNDDQLSFLKQTLSFVVTAYKRRGRTLGLSRRRHLEREAQREARKAQRKARKAQRETREAIKAGSIHEGKVQSLTDFGAFVDLGGVQGMIHVSEISHARVSRPADKLKVGDPVRVRVLKAEPKKGRIALSLKALEADPWEAIPSLLKVNQIATGRVVRVTEFGVFVEVAPGVDGLMHVSEVASGGLDEMKELAAQKQEINVTVLRIEPAKKRISLAPAPDGMKPGEMVKQFSAHPGSAVTGLVESASADGVVVRLGPGQVGFIPPNETSTPRGADLQKAFPAGKEITATVMRSERGERRVRLSVRRAERQEERRQLSDYRKSAVSGAGSFATLGDFFNKDD